MRWRIILSAAALMPSAAPLARAQRVQIPFSDEAVVKAMDKAKAHLWSLYRPPGRRQSPWPDVRTVRGSDGQPRPYENYGGRSALVMYALLAAGEKATEGRMVKAIRWLQRLDTDGTYTLGIRAQVWAHLPKRSGRPWLKKDAAKLVRSVARPPARSRSRRWEDLWGTYTYQSTGDPAQRGDASNTHIGVLGVWAAARMDVEIPRGYWKLIYEHYVRTQSTDGTWRYHLAPGPAAPDGNYGQYPPGGMTAAGLANLLVAWENIHAVDFVRCGRNPDLPAIVKALKWLGENMGRHANGYHYYLYALERVGLASGYKFLGGKDWYRINATRLLNTQRADGSWARAGFGDCEDMVATAFALIFLARGRNPVLLNRLQYDGDWNNRPRALSYLTRWAGGQFEREINWQIVDVATAPEQWHDAPVLLISGAAAPKLGQAELDKLRRYVQEGGRLMTVTECRGRAFDAAWRGGGPVKGFYEQLFGDYELKLLPRDHPIYNIHFKIRRAAPLYGLSNGVRLLALHTTEDLTLPWQTNRSSTAGDRFQLAVNIALFLNDHTIGRARGASTWPERPSAATTTAASVARIRHAGNWDPEPLAWERLAILMARDQKVKLTCKPVEIGVLDAKVFPAAHMTGTAAVTLSADERKALKAYVESGGTLIIEAAGGSEAFAKSMADMLAEMYGAGAPARLSRASPVYRLKGMEIESVTYRRAANEKLAPGKRPRIEAIQTAGRAAVFFSREDLTSGLVGYPSSEIVGYSPGKASEGGSAVELMRNMVLYANGRSGG